MPSHGCNVSRGSLTDDQKEDLSNWAPAARTASAVSGIFPAVMSDYLSAYEPEDARGGRRVRAGDEGPSVPIIVEPLKQPAEVPAPPAPPAPQEPVREPEKVPA